MSGGPGGGPAREINVTPLVDVCLVLLIMFMVAVPRNVPEVSVRIPPDRPGTRSPDAPLVVHLDEAGKLKLDREPVSLSGLGAELQRGFAARQKRVVFLDFADAVAYGPAVDVIGAIERAGADTIAIRSRRDRKVPERL